MRKELPEEINRVADAMTETEEILRSFSSQKDLAQRGLNWLSPAREKLEALAEELRLQNQDTTKR